MTPRETGDLIVQRWRAEHSATSIMVQLIVLGMPATRADVLAVIGAYAGNSSENRAGKGETMIDVLGLQIPTQAIGGLALFFGAGLAAMPRGHPLSREPNAARAVEALALGRCAAPGATRQ